MSRKSGNRFCEKRTCSNKKIEQDDDSKKSHPALVPISGKPEIGVLARARALVDRLSMSDKSALSPRELAHFGANKLEDGQCVRLSVILRNMRFKQPKARNSVLTAGQAANIINEAHEKGLHSIALAQAFQFDCTLRQRDVIGEWVPIEEKTDPSEIIDGTMKWARGLRWTEIDEDLILRHITSWGGKLVERRLSDAPLVMAESRRIRAERGNLPRSCPVVLREYDNLPWADYDFRRAWRKVAKAAGVPDNVFNMDSRPRAGGDENPQVVAAARKDTESAR
jgi:hypothetical protein